MKYVLTLKQNFPFAQNPRFCELEGNKIMCNDISLGRAIDPDASSLDTSKFYVIGNEYGAICALWANNDQDALDNAVDANMLDCLMAEEQNIDTEEVSELGLNNLGNAGELFDLSHVWMGEVELDPARDIKLIVALVRANEAGHDVIGD